LRWARIVDGGEWARLRLAVCGAVVGFVMAVPGEDWKGSLLDPADEKAFVDSVSKSAGRFAVPVGVDINGAAAGMFASGIPQMQLGPNSCAT